MALKSPFGEVVNKRMYVCNTGLLPMLNCRDCGSKERLRCDYEISQKLSWSNVPELDIRSTNEKAPAVLCFNLRQARSELRLKNFFASGNIMKLSWILKSIEFFSTLKNEKSKLWLLLSNMLSWIHSFPHSLFSFMWFIFFEFKDVSVDAL